MTMRYIPTLEEITTEDKEDVCDWVERYIITHQMFTVRSAYKTFMYEKKIQHKSISYIIMGKLKGLRTEGKVVLNGKMWESKVYSDRTKNTKR